MSLDSSSGNCRDKHFHNIFLHFSFALILVIDGRDSPELKWNFRYFTASYRAVKFDKTWASKSLTDDWLQRRIWQGDWFQIAIKELQSQMSVDRFVACAIGKPQKYRYFDFDVCHSLLADWKIQFVIYCSEKLKSTNRQSVCQNLSQIAQWTVFKSIRKKYFAIKRSVSTGERKRLS